MVKRTQLSDDFKLRDSIHGWLKEKKIKCNLEEELEAFKDFHISKGTLMADWNRAFQTWIRKGLEFGRIQKTGDIKPPVRRSTFIDYEKEEIENERRAIAEKRAREGKFASDFLTGKIIPD